MRKKISIIAGLALALVIAVASTLYFTLPYRVNKSLQSSLTYSKEDCLITSSKNQIKILQLTDLHVNGKLDMPVVFSVIKKLIYKTTPDLIVITGDVFSSGCRESDVTLFIDFIQKFNLPWAAVLGNHDDETPYSLVRLSSMLERASFSLFKKGDLPNLYGNYFYNVKFADGGMFEFIFMDSRSAGFTKESVNFYQIAVESSYSSKTNDRANNFLFFHIPLPETVQAVEANGGSKDIREEVCIQSTSVGFFDKVVEVGKTKALIYGHDHTNNAKINYMGIDFNYGLKTGPSAANKKNLVGGTLYNLNSDGTYTVEDVFA